MTPQYTPARPTLEKYRDLLSGVAGQSTNWYLYVLNSLYVPISFMVNKLGRQDSHLALIIYTAFHIPAATWLASGFIRTIPLELEEAARLDGCSLL